MPFPRCKEIVFAEVSALERVDNCCWLGGCLGRWLLTILIRSSVDCCWMVVGCWLFWSDLLRYFSPDHWAGDLATPLTPCSGETNKQFLKSGSPEWEGRLLLQRCRMRSQHHFARWWLWPWWPWWWPRLGIADLDHDDQDFNDFNHGGLVVPEWEGRLLLVQRCGRRWQHHSARNPSWRLTSG